MLFFRAQIIGDTQTHFLSNSFIVIVIIEIRRVLVKYILLRIQQIINTEFNVQPTIQERVDIVEVEREIMANIHIDLCGRRCIRSVQFHRYIFVNLESIDGIKRCCEDIPVTDILRNINPPSTDKTVQSPKWSDISVITVCQNKIALILLPIGCYVIDVSILLGLGNSRKHIFIHIQRGGEHVPSVTIL